MYRIVLSCSEVPMKAGEEAAIDITGEFAEHRKWHRSVKCTWDGSSLFLEACNEYDSDGTALIDEFSDCVSAFVSEGFDGGIRIESITEIPEDGT